MMKVIVHLRIKENVYGTLTVVHLVYVNTKGTSCRPFDDGGASFSFYPSTTNDVWSVVGAPILDMFVMGKIGALVQDSSDSY